MSKDSLSIQSLPSTEVRQNWSKVLSKVHRGKTAVTVEKSGVPVAVLLSIDDFQALLDALDATADEGQSLLSSNDLLDKLVRTISDNTRLLQTLVEKQT